MPCTTWFGGINVEGIRPLFWLQFVVRIILLGFVYLKVTEIGRSGVEVRWTSPLKDFAEVIRRGKATKRWLLFLSLNMFTRTMVETFIYPYAHEIKGADQFIVGGITTTIILTETIFSTPLGRFADRFGRKKMFYMLIPLFSLGNLLLVLSPSPQWLILVGFLIGFRMISTFAYGSMTPELVPPDCIGRWRGLVGFFTGLVSLPAPIIGGFIWERMGPHWVFITPILIDVFIRMAILYTVPETLNQNTRTN